MKGENGPWVRCGCHRWRRSGGQVGWRELAVAPPARWGEVCALPPFLEEAHALASTVGAPEVAAAGGRVATVTGPVVAVAAAANARAPENVDQRRSSETTSSNTSLSFRAGILYGIES